MFRGDISPRTVLRRIKHLARNPYGSATAASILGNPELVGWDRKVSVTADLWDAVVGVAPRKKGSKAPRYPRPTAKNRNTTGIPLASLAPHRRRRG